MLVSINIFGLKIQTFGLFFAFSFLAWGAVAARRFKELGMKPDLAWEAVVVSLVGGLVGARLYWALDNWDVVSKDVVGRLFSGSGLTWYGGLFGGIFAVFIWSKWRRLPSVTLLDLAAPCLALGYAIGRIGCQLSGDGDYGKQSSLPWAMGYPDGTVPTEDGVTVHPTPIYETLFMGSVALVLWHLRDRVRAGALFSIWLIAAGLERFLVEFLRRNSGAVAGLTEPQAISLVLILAGATWLFVISRGGGILRGDAGAAALDTTKAGR